MSVLQKTSSLLHSIDIRKLFSSVRRQLVNMTSLQSLRFDNVALEMLPMDSEEKNYVRQVSGACFSKVKPTPVENPQLVACSASAMSLLGLSDLNTDELERYFSGNKLLPGCSTAAHCYCGHQFGHFSGQLGDGAAMYLGEVINSSNERWEIQLKGAGRTPYSRTADGRKVLRSSIREFLCSEAIHFLGIPSTRAGTCVTSDSRVVRDIFYNGNTIMERCTIVLRIAPTFLRFGSFEIFKGVDSVTGREGPSVGRSDILATMLDYTVKMFYPEIWITHHENKPVMYIEFYKDVVRRTARLVADWQCVGWCHGVLNTDNMSIVGVTIDYGPFGFMDRFDPGFICNGSDDGGRYTYEKQPEMCRWNCKKLAEAIQDVVPIADTMPHLKLFDVEYESHYMKKMRMKFGLVKSMSSDKDLVSAFLHTMHETGADFTNSFRCLSRIGWPTSETFDRDLTEVTEYLLTQCCSAQELKQAYKPRMDPRQLQMLMMLLHTNPDLLEQIGRGGEGLEQEMKRMDKSKEIKNLTDGQKTVSDLAAWSSWLQSYKERLVEEAKGLGDLAEANRTRLQLMNNSNPRIILRNHIAQQAIDAAEEGDFSEVQRVLKILENPYSEEISMDDLPLPPESSTATALRDQAGVSSFAAYASKPPSSALDLRVT